MCREAKKEAVMKERRALQAPIVVAILPLSQVRSALFDMRA